MKKLIVIVGIFVPLLASAAFSKRAPVHRGAFKKIAKPLAPWTDDFASQGEDVRPAIAELESLTATAEGSMTVRVDANNPTLFTLANGLRCNVWIGCLGASDVSGWYSCNGSDSRLIGGLDCNELCGTDQARDNSRQFRGIDCGIIHATGRHQP